MWGARLGCTQGATYYLSVFLAQLRQIPPELAHGKLADLLGFETHGIEKLEARLSNSVTRHILSSLPTPREKAAPPSRSGR